MFESKNTVSFLLVYASNSFNSLNQQVTLCNIHHLWLSLGRVLVNTYECDVNKYLLIARLPSIMKYIHRGTVWQWHVCYCSYTSDKELLTTSDVKQVWFTDDDTTGGSIAGFHEWWSVSSENGPASATILIL